MHGVVDFQEGSGEEVMPGFSRGDTWLQNKGAHSACATKGSRIEVVGPGVAYTEEEEYEDGVLVRCWGCLTSFVLVPCG